MKKLKEALLRLENEEIDKIQIQLPDGVHYILRKDKLLFDNLNVEKYVPSVFDRREIISSDIFLRFFKFFNNEEYEILES